MITMDSNLADMDGVLWTQLRKRLGDLLGSRFIFSCTKTEKRTGNSFAGTVVSVSVDGKVIRLIPDRCLCDEFPVDYIEITPSGDWGAVVLRRTESDLRGRHEPVKMGQVEFL